MSARDAEDELIASYLLGELPPDEQAELEQRYFADPALLDRIDAVEDDLIDDYARRELPPARRQRFENHFLNEKRLERVRMAETLHRATRPPAPVRRIWAFEIAAVLAAAAMLVIVWLGMANREMRAEIEMLQAERRALSARKPVTNDPPPKTVPPPSTLPVAAIVLAPGLTRDPGDVTILNLGPKSGTVRLEALLDVRAARYEATLQRSGEAPVWRASGLVPQTIDGAPRLVLFFPREQFDKGDYILTVTAPDVIADYAFTVNFSR